MRRDPDQIMLTAALMFGWGAVALVLILGLGHWPF